MTTKTCFIVVFLVSSLGACETQKSEMMPPESMNSTTISVEGVSDTQFGLSKTSVFDTPDPQKISYSDKFPGTSTVLPRAYLNAPPQIPHNIDNFKPITTTSNACMGCHNNPSLRGEKIQKGLPTPIPESHYIDLRHNPGVTGEQIVEARYVCTQCHVPQANVDVLIENTFQNSAENVK